MQKWIWLVLVVVISFCSCSQKVLEGTYSTPPPEEGLLFSGDIYHFFDSNRVEVTHWSDDLSSNKFGEGTFALDGKKLSIEFDDVAPRNPFVQDKDTTSGNADIIAYSFNLINIKSEPLIGVVISAIDGRGNEINYTTSNPHGFAKMEIPSRKEQITINFTYTGFENVVFESKNKQSKELTIRMPENRLEYKSGDNLNYKIKLKKGVLQLIEGDKYRILNQEVEAIVEEE